MEELALPTRAIQLSGEVLSTDEAASAELHEAEAVHQTRRSRHLFKAAPMTPCICQELQLETGLSNKHLKRTLELLLHCSGPAKPRLLRTAVPHTAAVVWTGTTGTRPAHNTTEKHEPCCHTKVVIQRQNAKLGALFPVFQDVARQEQNSHDARRRKENAPKTTTHFAWICLTGRPSI